MFNIYQLPIDFKIPENIDNNEFINKVYNMVVHLAEENNIEVISDNWSTCIESNIE
ncbi:hypothetical protein [Clostridium butyricum]|uniref:hypothetical protein n=1 Tax=Clostridium butyricum TaxID=1492 RepID=UPI0029151099|nr:hypothetical protein [Clostridium butyricum]